MKLNFLKNFWGSPYINLMIVLLVAAELFQTAEQTWKR